MNEKAGGSDQNLSSATLGLTIHPQHRLSKCLYQGRAVFTDAHRLEALADGLMVQLLRGLEALLVARARRPGAVAQVLTCRAAPDALQ